MNVLFRGWIVAALFLGVSTVHAQDEVAKPKAGYVWGGMIFAVAEKKDAHGKAGGKLKPDIEKLLTKAFPKYKSFQVLREEIQPVYEAYESWVFPKNRLMLRLDSRGKTGPGVIRMDIQLWQNKKVLVKTDAAVGKSSPVIIEGPPWGKGRILFVLRLADPPKKAKQGSKLPRKNLLHHPSTIVFSRPSELEW